MEKSSQAKSQRKRELWWVLNLDEGTESHWFIDYGFNFFHSQYAKMLRKMQKEIRLELKNVYPDFVILLLLLTKLTLEE